MRYTNRQIIIYRQFATHYINIFIIKDIIFISAGNVDSYSYMIFHR